MSTEANPHETMRTRITIRSGAAAAVVLLVVAVVSCSKSPDNAAPVPSPGSSGRSTDTVGGGRPTVFPGATWATATPEQSGVSAASLKTISEAAAADNSDCLLAVRDGKIVYEQTWGDTQPDTVKETFSASKSFTSTLVGIAQEQGKLRIDDKASKYITEWKGTDSEAVTIKELLSNNSGRYYDFQNDYVKMAIEAPDKSAFAIGLGQQHPPGTHWEYNNSAIQTLETVLERATGQDMEAYAKTNLFEPIGMNATIARDNAGNPLAFMGVRTSCRDLARFGLLFLQGGKWNGRQVVPAKWVDEATHRSQDLNKGYGYLWWLFGTRGGNRADDTSSQAMGTHPGSTTPGAATAPDVDAFAALGLAGQIVLVVPGDDLVLVRTGKSKPGNEAGLVTTMFWEGHRSVTGG